MNVMHCRGVVEMKTDYWKEWMHMLMVLWKEIVAELLHINIKGGILVGDVSTIVGCHWESGCRLVEFSHLSKSTLTG